MWRYLLNTVTPLFLIDQSKVSMPQKQSRHVWIWLTRTTSEIRYQFEKLSEPTRRTIPDFPWNCDNNLRIAGSSPSWPICNLCSRSFFKIASTTLNCNIRAEWLVEKISFLVFIFSWVHFLLFRRTPERQKSTKTFAKTFLQVFIRDFLYLPGFHGLSGHSTVHALSRDDHPDNFT